MSGEATPEGGSNTATNQQSETANSVAKSGGWRRVRERAGGAVLAFLLLGFGLAAGPMMIEPKTPVPPNIVQPAALLAAPAPDAPVEPFERSTKVQVAASLRRLVPPEADFIDYIELETPQATSHPAPEVEVTVDISDQRLTLVVDGVEQGYYKVSTGLGRSWTPTGNFPPKWLSRHHRSSIYNNAPMPYSVFFNGNIALHGTNHIRKLGRPASKGCVRLHPSHARTIFNLVHRRGRDKVQINVQY